MFVSLGYLVAKVGMENKVKEFIERFSKTPGIISISLHKVRGDKNDFIEYIRWVDVDAHNSVPDFQKQYEEFLDLLAEEPKWYSGNMVYSRD